MTELLTVSEAARELAVAAQTVRRWVDRGRLPAMRTSGGHRIFQRVDVERVRDERRTAHDDEAA